MKRLVIILSFLSFLFFYATAYAEMFNMNKEVALRLSSGRKIYSVGEKIIVKCSIFNFSNKSYRFVFIKESIPFEIKDAKGKNFTWESNVWDFIRMKAVTNYNDLCLILPGVEKTYYIKFTLNQDKRGYILNYNNGQEQMILGKEKKFYISSDYIGTGNIYSEYCKYVQFLDFFYGELKSNILEIEIK